MRLTTYLSLLILFILSASLRVKAIVISSEQTEVVKPLVEVRQGIERIVEEQKQEAEVNEYNIDKGYGKEEIIQTTDALLDAEELVIEEEDKRYSTVEEQVVIESYSANVPLAMNVEVEENLGVKEADNYYESLTEEEKHLLEVVVQHEVGGLSREYRVLIAELLYNRLKSGVYPSDVKEMLYAKNQFQGIEEWYNPYYEVDEITKEVVKEVFTKENPSHDAIAYYNPELSEASAIEWFEYSGDVEFVFEYAESSWGVEYRTRFFK